MSGRLQASVLKAGSWRVPGAAVKGVGLRCSSLALSIRAPVAAESYPPLNMCHFWDPNVEPKTPLSPTDTLRPHPYFCIVIHLARTLDHSLLALRQKREWLNFHPNEMGRSVNPGIRNHLGWESHQKPNI